ncbi:uncharacterized protein LOC131216942 isoform X3 [Magnolia sinica]|uniref:uncharacterized protein LOC131216942 isoform X3 n=1 Tax=Magnolia sinica TaxID=86752 RepID=UPI002659CD21|nr:uncharacterized protein LOC131216942 isoform X3 [Magnolia sinica]
MFTLIVFLYSLDVKAWRLGPTRRCKSPSVFAGDFANENVELVRSIANLTIPKAAILGNHDCWYTPQFSEKKKDSVQLQLACLGEQHVGYCHLDFPTLKLSIVGGRPFSCGGDQLFRKRLLSARYGVSDMVGSAKKIYEAALGIPDDHSIIFLAHNGPTDLAQALSDLKKSTRLSIPLVVFGHMHKELAYGNGLRKMIVVGADNTVYLNGAIVPRVKHSIGELGTSSRSYGNNEVPFQADGPHATLRAFTLIEMSDGRLEKITECWVSVSGDKVALEEENILFNSCTGLSS